MGRCAVWIQEEKIMKFKIGSLVLALALIFAVGSAFSMPPPGGSHDGGQGVGHSIDWEIHTGNGFGHTNNDPSFS